MAIVVSDTSPIVALSFLGHFHQLERLFGKVLVPPSVIEELHRPQWIAIVSSALESPFLIVQAPRDAQAITAFRDKLDAGESDALALAVEVSAEAVLIDERHGRAVAKRLGLVPVGVLGILLRMKESGLIDRIRPLVDRLQLELNFRISPSLRTDVLRDAGEA